ncbi:MAG: YqeG family HAD IIIA-type phosphatase [Oscillospiraceae bacterium]
MNLPIPALMARDIYALTPQDFAHFNVKFLLMDLDNTLSPYHIQEADDRLRAWIQSLKDSGLELFILSNNHGNRPAHFAAQLGVDYIKHAKKPHTAAALSVIKSKGYAPNETAILGDQIYTDVLCGVRCGCVPICVRPICISHNPLIAVRYFLEIPFRLAYKRRKRNESH